MNKTFDVDSFFIISAILMNYPPAGTKKELQESCNKRVYGQIQILTNSHN